MLSKIIYQVKVELKYNFLPQVFANLIIIGLAYFIFGLKNLDEYSQEIIVERFLPIGGVFTLVTLFYTEGKSPIKDILTVRKTRIEFIYIIRFILRFILYGTITWVYIFLLSTNPSFLGIMKVFLPSVSIGFIIGILGLLVFSLSNNISLALLSSIALVLAQWFTPKDRLNSLLFYMPKISGIGLVYIFGICLILLVLAINFWKRKLIT